MLVNGAAKNEIDLNDRGFLYGDGVFRTIRLRAAQPLNWSAHYAKLQFDCAALQLVCPEKKLLLSEILMLATQFPHGVAKIIVTRGVGQRGYTPSADSKPTRVVTVSAAPANPENHYSDGVKLHICNLRLANQPRLAGIKHLNRLENVLAAAEWSDPDIAEGLLMDSEGNVVEGTRSNLFAIINGELRTSPLTRCGVAGVQRDRVKKWAFDHQFPQREADFKLDEFLGADEIFLVNSVFVLWPVREFAGFRCSQFLIAHQIQSWLADENH